MPRCSKQGLCNCGSDECAWPSFCLAWRRIGQDMTRRVYEEWGEEVE